MITKEHAFSIKHTSSRLLILLLIIAVCVVSSLHCIFIRGTIAAHTHAFYIPITLAGLWYHKKAIYVALFLGLVYLLAIHFSPLSIPLDSVGRTVTFLVVAYIVGALSKRRAEGEEALRKRNEQIIHYQTTLLKLTKIDYSNLDSVLKEITKTASQTLRVEMVGVGFLNEERSEVTCEQFYRLSTNLYEERYPLESSGYPRYFQALEDERIIAANDVYTDPRTRELTEDYLKPHEITSTMDVPIRLHGKFVGILYHEHVGPKRKWTLEEQDFAASVADLVALALEDSERKRAEELLKLSFIQLAETVSRAMEIQDPYTAGHQRRVAEMSQWVGKRMGLSKEELLGLYIAGLLHDVGKIAIPMVILTYPGKLGEAEWALIHSHTHSGYEILKKARFPWPVAELALHHHERLDGSGYPDGLKGNKLSRGVRILAVCDVVEAMSSARPYRPARTREEVQEELLQGKGTKYDPQVTDILLNLLNKNQMDYSKFLEEKTLDL